MRPSLTTGNITWYKTSYRGKREHAVRIRSQSARPTRHSIFIIQLICVVTWKWSIICSNSTSPILFFKLYEHCNEWNCLYVQTIWTEWKRIFSTFTSFWDECNDMRWNKELENKINRNRHLHSMLEKTEKVASKIETTEEELLICSLNKLPIVHSFAHSLQEKSIVCLFCLYTAITYVLWTIESGTDDTLNTATNQSIIRITCRYILIGFILVSV